MDPDQIQTAIEKVPAWWHHIDIGGIVTPGITHQASHDWITAVIDEDLQGKDVLDIGAWDGYYSFLAEKRGASSVQAIDANKGPSHPKGFETAKQLLKSKVEHRILDVYDLDRLEKKFDLIFFFGVYYHLWNPILAFQKIFDQLNPGGTVLIEGLIRSGSKPYLYAYRGNGTWCPAEFCAATPSWINVTCERIGFEGVEFMGRYPGDNLLEVPVRKLAWALRLHQGRLKMAHRGLFRAVKPKIQTKRDFTN